MNATAVVIDTKRLQLSLQIERIPEKQTIEILASQGADQSFHERMRYRRVRNRFDFLDPDYP